MRIEWLAEDLTEAMIIRGFWRWKRCAMVRLLREEVVVPHVNPALPSLRVGEREVWRYFVSEREVECDIDEALRLEAKREAHRQDWAPVVKRRFPRRLT